MRRRASAEIPNLKECYELYHDKGFEIVGLSLDDGAAGIEGVRRGEADSLDRSSSATASPAPRASYYGVLGIPTMILVGKDGKVVSLDAHGDTLLKELELLGPVPEKKDKKRPKRNPKRTRNP